MAKFFDMKIIVLLSCLFLSICSHSLCQARLGESLCESAIRYGSPVNEPNVIMLPLLDGTIEKRYHHTGWRIRAAYVNDKTVIISYMKLVRQSTPDAVILHDEISAILKAESQSHEWIKVKRGTQLTESRRYQEVFNTVSRLWQNANGSIAYVSGNNGITLISQEGLAFEANRDHVKEIHRKRNTTQF